MLATGNLTISGKRGLRGQPNSKPLRCFVKRLERGFLHKYDAGQAAQGHTPIDRSTGRYRNKARALQEAKCRVEGSTLTRVPTVTRA